MGLEKDDRLGAKLENVFARVLRQAEERRAEQERVWAEKRFLEGQRALILRLLVRRFGTVSEESVGRIRNANMEALDRYAEKLVVARAVDEVFSGD